MKFLAKKIQIIVHNYYVGAALFSSASLHEVEVSQTLLGECLCLPALCLQACTYVHVHVYICTVVSTIERFQALSPCFNIVADLAGQWYSACGDGSEALWRHRESHDRQNTPTQNRGKDRTWYVRTNIYNVRVHTCMGISGHNYLLF